MLVVPPGRHVHMVGGLSPQLPPDGAGKDWQSGIACRFADKLPPLLEAIQQTEEQKKQLEVEFGNQFSAVGVIEQTLQTLGKRRRQTHGPGRVDEPHMDHVEQVDTVLETPGR